MLENSYAWLRMNKSYLHDQRAKRQLTLLDKFLAVRRQYSHVAIALICVFV